jgi:hypothetical protein
VLRPEIPVGHVHCGDFMLGLDPFDVGFIDQGIQDVPDPVPVVPEIIFDSQLFKTIGHNLATCHFRHVRSPFRLVALFNLSPLDSLLYVAVISRPLYNISSLIAWGNKYLTGENCQEKTLQISLTKDFHCVKNALNFLITKGGRL